MPIAPAGAAPSKGFAKVMSDRSFQFTAQIRSFKSAVVGIWTMLKSQHNAWIHAAATVGVVAAGLYFGVSSAEWC